MWAKAKPLGSGRHEGMPVEHALVNERNPYEPPKKPSRDEAKTQLKTLTSPIDLLLVR